MIPDLFSIKTHFKMTQSADKSCCFFNSLLTENFSASSAKHFFLAPTIFSHSDEHAVQFVKNRPVHHTRSIVHYSNQIYLAIPFATLAASLQEEIFPLLSHTIIFQKYFFTDARLCHYINLDRCSAEFTFFESQIFPIPFT